VLSFYCPGAQYMAQCSTKAYYQTPGLYTTASMQVTHFQQEFAFSTGIYGTITVISSPLYII